MNTLLRSLAARARLIRLLLPAALLAAVPAVRGQVVFNFTGTAASTSYGYTSGQAVTFTFTLDSHFPNTTSSAFDGSANIWVEGSGTDPQLFTAITGSFTGTFTRPAAPQSLLATTVGIGDLEITVESNYDMGVFTLSNDPVRRFAAQLFGPVGDPLSFTASGNYSDPASYFAGFLGSHAIDPGRSYLAFDLGHDNEMDFQITNLTISAIPEPATYAVLFGTLALGVVGVRECRKRRARTV